MTAMDVDHPDEEDGSIDSVPQLMNRPMNKDEHWYLLDKKWFETFKTYLTDKNAQCNNPGPIDNGSLFKSTDSNEKAWELRESLEENNDYVFVPEEAWNILIHHFGIVDERHTIKRTVIQQGQSKHNYPIVEVYPIDLKLCLYGSSKDLVMKSFSRVTKLNDVIAEMKSTFKIAPERNTQLWANGSVLTADTGNSSSSSHLDQLESITASSSASASSSSSLSFIAPTTPPSSVSKNNTPIPLPPPPPPANHHTNSPYSLPKTVFLHQTLSDVGVHSGLVLTLEVKNADGTWPSSRPKYSSNLRSGVSGVCTPGLCGLMNLGNTCFMNSALQCMSNCPPLTDYFLSDSHIPDINEKNPLGMNGQIARAYATLIKQMWSGNTSCLAPREFKMVLGRFAPQFSGFQQQDCQELMASLLDGLHEDLNRITVKPYIELNTGIDQRPDLVLAAESWSNYKKRNDSIIIDTFHGLLKSTLVCPDCKLVSVTFDPFCYLSLPLPVKRERAIEVTLYRTAPHQLTPSGPCSSLVPTVCERLCLPIKLTKLMVPKIGQISDICNAVAKAVNERSDDLFNREKGFAQTLSPDRLIVAEVYQHRFQKLFSKDDSYTPQLDEVHVFETVEDKLPIPVYLREVKDDGTKQLFGQPFIINIDPQNPLIFEAVYHHVKQWFDLESSNDDSPDRSSPIMNARNGDIESDPDEGVACDENSFASLFSLTFVNSYGSIDSGKYGKWGEIKSSKVYFAADFSSRMRSKYREELESNCNRIPMSSARSNFASGTSGSGSRAPVSLSDCINQFTTIENLGAEDPWYCPRCKQHKEATKKFDLWSLPKVLIIHLKRFSYSRFWRDKLDTLVDFPVTGLDMSTYVISDREGQEFVYDLIAVANHYGGLGGGHYTAYAKNRETRQWHYFDDSNVTPASDENVVSKAAYVLFYQRREKADP